MEHWDRLRGDQGFYWDDGLFRPSTDTFLLGGFPVLRRGEQVCDLGAGTGLLGALLLTREPSLTVTGLELREDACPSGPAHRPAQRLAGAAAVPAGGPAAAGGPAPGGRVRPCGVQSSLFPSEGGACLSAGDTECRPVGGGVYAGGCVPGRRLAAAVGRALLRSIPHRAAGGTAGDGPPLRAGAQAAAAGAARCRRGSRSGAAGVPPGWEAWAAGRAHTAALRPRRPGDGGASPCLFS